MVSSIDELDVRTYDQVPQGARDEDLAVIREGSDGGGDVHSYADEIVSMQLTLAGVNADLRVEADGAEALDDRATAANCTSRAVEAGKDPVSRVLDLASPKAIELSLHHLVMTS